MLVTRLHAEAFLATEEHDDEVAELMTVPTLGPYAQSAQVYRQNGWLGVLPVVGKSGNLPIDHTGRTGSDPDAVLISQWINGRGSDNVCLRLPDTVIGIDVDAYDNRNGAQTLAWFEQNVGSPLPPTWTSTSRDDGDSRIYFYRVPEGIGWPSDLGRGSNVEIIRRQHRYAVVWPSVHPDTSRRYRWYKPDLAEADEGDIPRVDDLAELPQEWIDAITTRGGRHRGSSAGGTPGLNGSGGRDGLDHSEEDVDAFTRDGEPIDIAQLYDDGIAPGDQNNLLFGYLCSLRELGLRRIEMIALAGKLMERSRDQHGREPWTEQDIIGLVDRVRSTYGPQQSGLGDLSPAMREFAQRLRAGEVADDEDIPRDPLATDLGNTLRFVRLMKDRVRYAADENRWYVWDGNRWAVDLTNQVLELTIAVVDDIRAEAMTINDTDERQRWINWAHQSESMARRKSIMDGARANQEIVVTADQFDADPWLLVVRNGTVDLRTGKLRDSNPRDLCTMQASVTFDANADCPKFREHVDFVACGDKELANYLVIQAGYSLTGMISERSFYFLEGTGRNGKNVFVEPILNVMGSYATVASSSLLTGGDEQHPTILADLRGKRMVFIDEVRQGRRLNVERIKALTGSAKTKARRMREDFFEFPTQFKLWIAGNGQPTVKDPSDGAWDRMKRVPFDAKVPDAQVVKDYAHWLYENESSGILNLLLKGVKYWAEMNSRGDPLVVPSRVVEAVQEHRHSEDLLQQFAEEFPVVWTGLETDVIMAGEVYRKFRDWAIIDAGHSARDLPEHIGFGMRYTRLIGIKSGKRKKINGRSQAIYIGWKWDENSSD